MELIAAVDRRWGLGRDGKLLFSIPEDLAFFREKTWGHTIVLGRRTLETFPAGKPLPGRENLVLTWKNVQIPGARTVSSLDALMQEVKAKRVFVVGGGMTYRALLPACTRAYLTRIDADGNADCWLPDLDRDPDWRLTEIGPEMQFGSLSYRRCIYERVPCLGRETALDEADR